MNCRTMPVLFAAASGLGAMASASAELPASIAGMGETAVATFHAEGAQIYECKIAFDGKLAWQFREPVATLLLDGKTVGRHYAGPNWAHMDGSAVMAKPIGSAPGQTQADIPWLKLEVIGHRGTGAFSSVTTVQRINTRRRCNWRLRTAGKLPQCSLCGGLHIPAQGIRLIGSGLFSNSSHGRRAHAKHPVCPRDAARPTAAHFGRPDEEFMQCPS